jgi:putative hydrolase of the HAD superfamily
VVVYYNFKTAAHKFPMTKSIIKNCKGVFFDLYGTLLDYNDMEKSNKIWLNNFYELIGVPNKLSFEVVEEICKKILLDDVNTDHQDSLTTYEAKIKFHFNNCGISFSREALKEVADESLRCWQDNITLSDDVIPVFEKLQRNKKIALISNFDHTPHVKGVVAKHKLDSYLHPIIISDEVKCKKPDPRIFHMTLEQTNLSADEVIFVGDSYNDDILGAQSANILPVMIKHKSNSHAHNNNQGDTDLIIIQTLSELLELLS